jgi:glycine cleavage system aminomethyltransferase T
MADFPARHIGPDETDEAAMLRALGVGTLEELAAETVPADIRFAGALDLPAPVDEAAILGELRAQTAAGIQRKLTGFVMTERGIARHGYSIFADAGAAAGTVTSGGPAPTLEKNVGLGYVPARLAAAGTKLSIDCRGKRVAAEVVSGPFYKRGKK